MPAPGRTLRLRRRDSAAGTEASRCQEAGTVAEAQLRAVTFTGDNRSGGIQLVRWVDAVPPISGRRSWPRRRLGETDCSTRRRSRLRTGQAALGGGAVLRQAARRDAIPSLLRASSRLHLGLLQWACALISYRQPPEPFRHDFHHCDGSHGVGCQAAGVCSVGRNVSRGSARDCRQARSGRAGSADQSA